MVIRLLTIGLGLCLIWGLYWAGAGWWLQTSITTWFDEQRQRGWQADYTDLDLSGFPWRHISTLSLPALADPETGTAWRAQEITIDSRAIWPGDVTVRFADAPQTLSYFDQTLAWDTQGLMADLKLKPGLSLELQDTALTSGPWNLSLAETLIARASTLTLSARQQEDPLVYTATLRADEFAPGDRLRQVARISRTLPETFDALMIEATVTWTKPWDRSAVETARPQPTYVDLQLADIHWGGLRLLAAGEFAVDAQGVPEGVITIRAENWRDMLVLAQDTGVMPAELASAAERALNLLEGLGGNPNALDLQLNLRGGAIALGPIPIGPAPRLILR